MSEGRYNAFLSDDRNAVSSLLTLLVVTGKMKNSSQRTTKQLSSMNTCRWRLLLMECPDCPAREGALVCEEPGFPIFARGEEGVEWSGEDGSDEPSLPFTPTRELWNKMEFCHHCPENWSSMHPCQ